MKGGEGGRGARWRKWKDSSRKSQCRTEAAREPWACSAKCLLWRYNNSQTLLKLLHARLAWRHRLVGSVAAAIDRLRLRKEALEQVVADSVVLLMKGRVRDPRHDRKLLVGVRQLLEEFQQIRQACDPVVLAAHDQGRHRDLLRIADRQVCAHVDVSTGRHRVVELEDGIGEGLDHRVVGGAGMVALEDRAHELAIDRAAVPGPKLGQALFSLGQRR